MSVSPTEFSAKVSQAWVSARLTLSGGSGDGSSSKTIIHWSAELRSGGRGTGDPVSLLAVSQGLRSGPKGLMASPCSKPAIAGQVSYPESL